MKKLNNNWWKWALAGLFFFANYSCKGKKSGLLEVKGTIQHADQLAAQFPQAVNNGKILVQLFEVPFGEEQPPVLLDSITLETGKYDFDLKGNTTSIGMYDIVIGNGPMIPLVNDAENISLNIDFGNKERFYTVKGSDASEQLNTFIFDYSKQRVQLNKALSVIDSLKRFSAADSSIISATNDKNKTIDELNKYLRNFLGGVKQPIVASFALGRAAETLPQVEFEKELNSLAKRFPDDPQMQELKKKFDAYKQQITEMEKMRQNKSWVGKPAPELVLPDASGKEIALSSFRGKFVLVDFWASWCGPCRIENPNVVAAYNRFKQRNFTILGVSLDKTRNAWLDAIKQDGLNWTQVSDLAYWNSKAVGTFGFEGIPFSVLIDPEGKVIAESLRGEELHNTLNEVLK